MQSTNEEMETAKEELQSTNEELTTLNEELQNRNEELGSANNDLSNLLTSIRRNDEGQDLLEYALLVALIAIVCVAAVGAAGNVVSATFSSIAGPRTSGASIRSRGRLTSWTPSAATSCRRAETSKWG